MNECAIIYLKRGGTFRPASGLLAYHIQACAEDVALANPGEVVYVLRSDQAQELEACDPDRQEAYLVRHAIPNVQVPLPEPIWDREDQLPREDGPQVVS